jgi:large subunit ribosomal protein L15
LIRKGKGPAKLLANGDAAKGVIVRGVKMSAGARQKIESAGGRVEN